MLGDVRLSLYSRWWAQYARTREAHFECWLWRVPRFGWRVKKGGKWYSRGNWKGPFVEAEEEAGWECGGTAAAAEEEKVVVGVSWPTAPREDEDVVVKDGAGVAIVLLCGLLLWILFIVGDNDDDDVVEGTFVGSLLELLIGYDGGSSRITRPLPMVGTW